MNFSVAACVNRHLLTAAPVQPGATLFLYAAVPFNEKSATEVCFSNLCDPGLLGPKENHLQPWIIFAQGSSEV